MGVHVGYPVAVIFAITASFVKQIYISGYELFPTPTFQPGRVAVVHGSGGVYAPGTYEMSKKF